MVLLSCSFAEVPKERCFKGKYAPDTYDAVWFEHLFQELDKAFAVAVPEINYISYKGNFR